MRTESPGLVPEASRVPHQTRQEAWLPFATPEIPRAHRHKSRWTPRWAQQLEISSVYPKSSWDEGQCLFFDWRGIPIFHSHQKHCFVSAVETREDSRGPCCKSKGHCVSPQLDIGQIPWQWLEWNSEFPVSTRREVWLPCSTSRKSPNSPPHLEMRPDTPFWTWDQRGLPWLNTRWCLTPLKSGESIQTTIFLLQQATDTWITASTRDSSRFLCHNSRRIPKCLWQREKSPDIPEKPREVHCRPHSYSRGTTSFLPQLE